MQLQWDENKRQSNLKKHGLDFADASLVLETKPRMDVKNYVNGEQREISFAYVERELTILCLVYTKRLNVFRIISFRKAHQKERSLYYEWESKNFDA
jgi:uncharacterized DUF497 family protein